MSRRLTAKVTIRREGHEFLGPVVSDAGIGPVSFGRMRVQPCPDLRRATRQHVGEMRMASTSFNATLDEISDNIDTVENHGTSRRVS